jgi:hypothetical protein
LGMQFVAHVTSLLPPFRPPHLTYTSPVHSVSLHLSLHPVLNRALGACGSPCRHHTAPGAVPDSVWCTSDWTCPPFAARWTPACPNPRFGTECGWCACVAFSIDCVELSIVLQCGVVFFLCVKGWVGRRWSMDLFLFVRGSCMMDIRSFIPSPSSNPLFTPIPFPIKSNPCHRARAQSAESGREQDSGSPPPPSPSPPNRPPMPSMVSFEQMRAAVKGSRIPRLASPAPVPGGPGPQALAASAVGWKDQLRGGPVKGPC